MSLDSKKKNILDKFFLRFSQGLSTIETLDLEDINTFKKITRLDIIRYKDTVRRTDRWYIYKPNFLKIVEDKQKELSDDLEGIESIIENSTPETLSSEPMVPVETQSSTYMTIILDSSTDIPMFSAHPTIPMTPPTQVTSVGQGIQPMTVIQDSSTDILMFSAQPTIPMTPPTQVPPVATQQRLFNVPYCRNNIELFQGQSIVDNTDIYLLRVPGYIPFSIYANLSKANFTELYPRAFTYAPGSSYLVRERYPKGCNIILPDDFILISINKII